MWTARILLEAHSHHENAFVTLTYEDAPPELVPRDMQLFMKKLRKAHSSPLRYFGVGEYGERLGRPHYHLAVFGLSVLSVSLVNDAWGLGFVSVGDLNQKSAQYIAGYTTKKLTTRITDGRHPEFARMSKGLGKGALEGLSEAISTGGAVNALAGTGDVPCQVRIAGKLFPLGPYLVRKLRRSLGFSEKMQPSKKLALSLELKGLDGSQLAARERRRAVGLARAEATAMIDSTKRKL